MDEQKFIELAALICEPVRAKMLWSLLDGRAYTATELAHTADISSTSASNHLAKMLQSDLVKVEAQGRHRYFSFARPEVAYAVESLANLANANLKSVKRTEDVSGIKYCRTCYDHLAGFAGVKVTEAMEKKKLIRKSDQFYLVTNAGWDWLKNFDISKDEMKQQRRPVARQCLDWSERRPHIAGQLGALLLHQMLQRNWFKKIKFSREMLVTAKGSKELYDLLKVQL